MACLRILGCHNRNRIAVHASSKCLRLRIYMLVPSTVLMTYAAIFPCFPLITHVLKRLRNRTLTRFLLEQKRRSQSLFQCHFRKKEVLSVTQMKDRAVG